MYRTVYPLHHTHRHTELLKFPVGVVAMGPWEVTVTIVPRMLSKILTVKR